MPTNLYGPNDNYDLASSHLVPRSILLDSDKENCVWSFMKCPLILHSIGKYSISQTAVCEMEYFPMECKMRGHFMKLQTQFSLSESNKMLLGTR